MISETISHYRVIKKLGAGGMGEVYKAQDLTLDRPVALKILPAYLVEDPDRVRRFVQEARAASALNHPHIVTIYEIGQVPLEAPLEAPLEGGLAGGAAREGQNGSANSDGSPESRTLILQGGAGMIHYIAMEFVDGATLHAKAHRERADLRKLLEYMAQVGDGLAKAHAAGIVHRDLKPENIMVTEDDYAKILDFGLAKLIEPKSPEPAAQDMEEAATAMMEQTRPGMVMGTIGYMSPEQVQGKGVDQRSDIFSFGCILYEIATGIKPFAGDSVIDSLHRIVYAQTPPIKDANPNAPVELQRIIRKCLAKDAAQRYQSIKDVAIDLRELLREYDSQPTVSGAFAQTAITGMQPQTVSTGPHSHPPITAPHSQYAVRGAEQTLAGVSDRVTGPIERRGSRLWPVIAAGLLLLAIAAAAVYYFQGLSRGKGRPAFEKTRITKLTSSGKALNASISPDGKYAAYVVNDAGKQSLWVRQVGTSSNAQLVPPAEVGYTGLTFSRDGSYIYYASAERGKPVAILYQVPVIGGPPRKILEDV
ncbi:MAG TPA: protein kinase, partial [Blastocatellia bacterium]|nr:protein kinase [Blastocatellia bacterium]